LIYIMSQKLRKQTIFNKNTHFTIRTKHDEFQSSTAVIWQGNLTSDHGIKQHNDDEKLRKTVQTVQLPLSYT